MNKLRKEQIEQKVSELHQEIWRNRHKIWPYGSPSPIEMLNPEIACRVLKIKYQEYEEFGSLFGFRGSKFKVAGLVDRQAGKIAVANNFSSEEIRFTAAHEIGHWLLHPQQTMFRDRPLSKAWESKRPQKEEEADYFAACYLMPKNLLGNHFKKRFLTIPFHFNDDTSYLLNPQDPDMLLHSEEGSMDRALVLAKCGFYNGQRFYPLANEFKVSITAMAIRLEELNLIKWP